MDPPKLITLDEVARMLSVSTATIKRMIRDGEFPVPIKPTGNTAAWLMDDVTAVIYHRIHGHRYQKSESRGSKTTDLDPAE